MASPLRILLAAAAAAALIFVLLKTAALPRYAVAGIALALWATIRWWAAKSAAVTKAQHQQEIEKLKHTPILKIDD